MFRQTEHSSSAFRSADAIVDSRRKKRKWKSVTYGIPEDWQEHCTRQGWVHFFSLPAFLECSCFWKLEKKVPLKFHTWLKYVLNQFICSRISVSYFNAPCCRDLGTTHTSVISTATAMHNHESTLLYSLHCLFTSMQHGAVLIKKTCRCFLWCNVVHF